MADNEVQIDSLTIAVEESANNAAKNLSSLASGLKKLQKVLSGLNVSSSVAQLNQLNSALDGIGGTNSDKITALASSLLDLKSVGKIGVSVPKSLSNQISALGTSLSGITESNTKRLSGLSAALKNLGAVKMPDISASLGRQLGKIVEAANQLQGIDLSKLSALADALRPLNDLGRAQLTSFINQLGKLPELSAQLDAVDMDRFATQIERLAAAMSPLATEMDKIAQGFSKFPVRIQKFIQNNEAATSSVKKSKTEMGDWRTVLGKILGELEKIEKKPSIFKKLFSLAALSKVQKVFENTVESANKYIEDLNLFNVSMSEFTEEGQKYAELVGDSYGIDPAEFMRMQAVVMDVSKSFGVATDTAYTMSKALTQLTYDISSLYNLKIDDAASKVQSALAGEIEPIRRLGKDLSVANLKLLATELGINANVDSMNQAEKAMLRTISLLRQSTSAMGDMSRTLDQPANQFRVLKAQIALLGRAVGDLLLPIVQKALPYLIAFIKVGQQVVMAFAKLAGFELPKFDYADSTVSGIEDIGTAADDAAKSVKKLYQLSFDELNILGSQNSSGTGSGTSAADIAKLEEELNRLAKIENDAFSKSLGETTDAIAKQLEEWLTKGKDIEGWAESVWEKLEGIKNSLILAVEQVDLFGDAIGLWKIDDDLITKLKNIGIALLVIKGAKTAIGIGKEIYNVGKLIGKLFGLGKATDTVTDAMSEKNKKLTEQTKETAKETEAVGELSPALDTATSSITAMAAALPLIGDNWSEVWQKVSDNPLTLNVDTSQVDLAEEKINEFVDSSFYQLNDWIVDSAAATTAWQAALNAVTGETTASINESWRTAFDQLNTDTVTASNNILSTTDDFGELLYSSLVNPIHSVDSEYAATFNNIYQNYAALMQTMGVSTSAYSASSRTSRGYSASGSRVASARKNTNQMVAFDDDGSGAYRGKQSDPEFERVWNEVTGNSSKNATFAKSIEYVLEKTLKLLKGVLGAASSAIGIPAFAAGGFPEDGMFYANSHELVGRFNNGRTAVANNTQIIEGIENAVYRAMSAAGRSSGRSGGKIELILDKQVVGRAFGDAIDTERRRSGANTKITFANGGTR